MAHENGLAGALGRRDVVMLIGAGVAIGCGMPVVDLLTRLRAQGRNVSRSVEESDRLRS